MLGVGLGLTQPRGRAAEFSPAELAGLVGWWDAADTSTITESGGAVSQFDDKSGNGNHVLQAVAANQPTTGTLTLNGKNVLDFDGGDWLVSSGNIGVSDATNFNVFAVATLDVAAAFSTIFATGQPGTTSRAAAFQVFSYLIAGSFMATDNWNPQGMRGDTAFSFGVPYVLSYGVEPWSSMTTSADLRLNGAPETETSYGTGSANTLLDGKAWLGAFGASLTPSRWNGQIAEVIVYDAVMDATQVSTVESYLSSKWGVTLA